MLPTTDHLIAAEESSAAAWMKGDATIAHAPHAIRYAQKAMAHVVS